MHTQKHRCAIKAQNISRQEIVKLLKEHPGTTLNKLINEKIKQMMMAENFQRDDVEQFAKNLLTLKECIMLSRKKK